MAAPVRRTFPGDSSNPPGAMALVSIPEISRSLDTVSGEGVVLRRPSPSDYEAWSALRAQSAAHLIPWEPSWAPDDLTRAGFRRRLRRYALEARDGVAASYFVFRTADGALVGGCNLNSLRRGPQQSAALGYWVGAPYQRRGYTRAAARALLRHAFEGLRLNRVEAACIPSNEPSRRLLESIGFRREGLARAYLRINGVWRDHLLYGMIDGDPIL